MKAYARSKRAGRGVYTVTSTVHTKRRTALERRLRAQRRRFQHAETEEADAPSRQAEHAERVALETRARGRTKKTKAVGAGSPRARPAHDRRAMI